MTVLDEDDDLLARELSFVDRSGLPSASSQQIGLTTHQVIAAGGDLESVLQSLLALGHLDRTALALGAISCRRYARAEEHDRAWRLAAVWLDAAARSGLFGSADRCGPHS